VNRFWKSGLIVLLLLGAAGVFVFLEEQEANAPTVSSSSDVRSSRRSYDGAPPVIPHGSFGMDCISCHADVRVEVPGVGISPPSPHETTERISRFGRCQQCHVFAATDQLFVEDHFEGFAQDLRRGQRLFEGAPPVIPHQVFMRENCLACHDGAVIREEIRSSHPERTRCLQCHVPKVTEMEFP